VPMMAEVGVTLIVGNDQDDVGLTVRSERAARTRLTSIASDGWHAGVLNAHPTAHKLGSGAQPRFFDAPGQVMPQPSGGSRT